MDIQTTTNIKVPGEFMADKILRQLDSGKNVLWFVTGGSSIDVAIEASKIISKRPHKNLTVMMTDERYGTLNHADSNWYQMMQKGFSLKDATLIPILTGDNTTLTTEKFNENLAYEFNVAGYTIGLFGVGKDGHTAGILPNSPAIDSEDLAFGYKTPTFFRITITPKLIEQLDEAVVFMQGEEKWKVVNDLRNKNIEVNLQPAQILKKVPILTIFTDYKKQ